MKEIKIVLLAAPEFSAKVAAEVAETLPGMLSEVIDSEINWTIEKMTDSFTSVAEDDEELLEGVVSMLETKNWDYAISLTDIPLFHEKEIVLARVNYAYQFGLIALPAFGWFIEGRVTDMALQVIRDIYYKDTANESYDQPHKLDQLFTLGKIRKIHFFEKETQELKYVFSSKMHGLMTILLGMTYDNQPWTIMTSLTRTIAVAFGSGAYAMVFPTIWNLSHEYSYLRLLVLMILAISGLGMWLVQGHNLWEKKETYKNQKYRKLYNTTTISTLLLAVGIFYLILFGLFLGTAYVLVEPHYYAEQIGIDQLPTFLEYVRIAWIAASVGTITGAVGVGLEDEENVRETTYGYRQRERYRVLEERRENRTEE